MTIFNRDEQVIFTAEVEHVNNAWDWDKTNLREEIAKVDSCNLLLESKENGKRYESPIYLDEPTKTTEMPT